MKLLFEPSHDALRESRNISISHLIKRGDYPCLFNKADTMYRFAVRCCSPTFKTNGFAKKKAEDLSEYNLKNKTR